MTKKEMRQSMLQQRRELTAAARSKIDDLLLIRFQQWVPGVEADRVLGFWPLIDRNEPNSFLLTDFLRFRNPALELCYPVIEPASRQMEAHLVTDDTRFALNAWGIAEPADGEPVAADTLQLVLVPLLAFDLHGQRLGYGGGFYDRFLPRCDSGCVFLGISQFAPVNAVPGPHEYDIPLHACITPEMIYEF